MMSSAAAGEDLVDGSDLGGIGGDEAAGVRHEDDVGDLAHVGGFAAHVGADQKHDFVCVSVSSLLYLSFPLLSVCTFTIIFKVGLSSRKATILANCTEASLRILV